MRISCEFCGAEYEVDETRIPAEGLPIKCARCLAVFVAHAPAAAQPAPASAPPPGQTTNWGGAPADPWGNPASGDPWAAPAVPPAPAWNAEQQGGWTDPNAAWGTGATQAWESPAPDPWAAPPTPPPPAASWGSPATGAAEQDPFAPPAPAGRPSAAPPSLDPALERMLAEDVSGVGAAPDSD